MSTISLDYIKFEVSDEIFERAKERFKFGSLKNSITKGAGNLAGAIGEEIVQHYSNLTGMGLQPPGKDYPNCDFVSKAGAKVEVKTKRSNYPPKTSHKATVADSSTHQDCDIYIFVSVKTDNREAYLCGWIGKDEFFSNAHFRAKGEPDPDAPAFIYSGDCYNIDLKHLNPFKNENN
jgi:hypothetical protein